MKWIKENKKMIQGIALFFAVLGGVCLLLYEPMMALLKDPDALKAQLLSWGWAGRAGLALIMAMQVAFAFLPGEIVEVLAGVIFGPIEGMLVCLAGAALGSALIYLFVSKFGIRFIERFVKREQIRELRFLQSEKKLSALVFVLFFIPGTPKDLMTYVMPLTPMKLPRFLIISSVARIPSVITSTVAGNSLMERDLWMAIGVFTVTGIVSLLGLVLYQRILKTLNEKRVKAHES